MENKQLTNQEVSEMENKALVKQEENLTGIRERLKGILEENKEACVKINGRLEITRPVALALTNHIALEVSKIGGSFYVKKEVLNFSPIVVKAIGEIRIGDTILHFEALGSAEESDISRDRRVYHDTLGTAETRAMKRLIEEMVGEDFINKVLKPISTTSNQTLTEAQKRYIKNLLSSKGLNEDYVKEQFLKSIDNLTKAEANKLISQLK